MITVRGNDVLTVVFMVEAVFSHYRNKTFTRNLKAFSVQFMVELHAHSSFSFSISHQQNLMADFLKAGLSVRISVVSVFESIILYQKSVGTLQLRIVYRIMSKTVTLNQNS